MKDTEPGPPPATVRELKASAVRRVLDSRTEPIFDTLQGPVGSTRIQNGGGELKKPATLTEWCDRTIAQTPTDAIGSALIVILAAAGQGGARTATAAVAVAGRLAEWDQWLFYDSLTRLTGELADVDHVITEVRREWRRLKLATKRPDTPLIIEKNRPVFASTAGGTAYSPGTPDWAIPAWVKR